MPTSLKEVAPGERCRVTGYAEGAQGYRRKLLALGLTRGAELTVVRVAPMGDPVEIRVRGTSVTLRKAEAEALQVERAQ